ncbi:CreA family protein [Pseudotabrizicola sp.]|uniref:CreA family protein n=1 Tax=Pseudotabrizicola sp. TaxID=2939647 RepID=UPI0027263951|nr:CreA family protein [Pseudotabrizicola sp.]MDO8884566.1 CreA family protein [Pseudotabrizicola sp.]
MYRAAFIVALTLATPALSEQIGRVGVDWVGNDIIIESVPDPKVQGITCHVAYFDRSLIDRLANGNWFEDPSYSAVDCVQTGPITLGNIARDRKGETVFSERQSLILKSLRVTRIYDATNNALVYLAHASELTQGSGKMSMSVIPLGNVAANPAAN